MPLIKYFIAIVPPEPLFSQIEAIKKEVSVKYNNKSALRSPAHITLHMPFEWKEEKEELLIDSINEIKFEGELEIRLKNYSCFEPKVVFIDVEKNGNLNSLQKKVVDHVKENLNIFNQYNDARAYHPHVTIAFRDLKKQLFYEMMKEYGTKDFEGVFTTDNFCLLKHNGKSWDIFKTFKFA